MKGYKKGVALLKGCSLNISNRPHIMMYHMWRRRKKISYIETEIVSKSIQICKKPRNNLVE